MSRPLRVHIVEDLPTDAELIVAELRRARFRPYWHRVDTPLFDATVALRVIHCPRTLGTES